MAVDGWRRSVVLWTLSLLVTVNQLVVRVLTPDASIARQGDALVYLAGGRALLGGQPLYAERLELVYAEGSMPFTYPVFGAIVLSPFSLLQVDVAAICLAVLSVACLVGTLAICVQHAKLPSWAIPVALPLATMSDPVTNHLQLGQVNLLLMLLVVADLLWLRHTRFSGVGLGIAIAIKLTPAVFLLLLVIDRRWMTLVRAVTTFLVATGIGFLVRPSDSWEYWTRYLRDPGRVGNLTSPDNQSLRGLVERLITGPVGGGLWVVLVASTVAAIGWLLWRRIPDDCEVLRFGLASLVALMISPISWSHHWVWAIPLVLGFAEWLRHHTSFLAAFVGLTLAVFSSQITNRIAAESVHPLMDGYKLWMLPFSSPWVLWAMAGIALCFVYDRGTAGAMRPAH